MRDIKFRGKDYSNKWRYGDLVQEKWGQGKAIMIKKDKTAWSVLEETIGQYTGLHDKNGKEIFEADIVKVKLYKGEEEKYFVGKVEYFGSNFIVDADNDSDYHVYDLDGFGIDYRYNLEDCEVIGNIYDNPELLEERG